MSLNTQELIEEQILANYQLVRKLGSGAYGHVWKVKCKATSNFYALKKVFSAFQNQLDAQRTFRQISLLSKLSHPNIAQLIKVIKAKNDMDIYLLFNYMESDLYKAIKGDYLNQVHKKYIIYQLAKILKYLHSGGILHRDLKPSNVLINADCKIQLCDFGLSRTTYSYGGQKPVITQFIATRWYRAPEVLLGSKDYTNKSDMWSLGCLIYELYARKPLLPGNDSMDQIQKMLQFKGIPNQQQKQSLGIAQIDKILCHFSVQKKLIGQYFSVIPNVQVKRILLKLLQYNPCDRFSAQQLLQSSFLAQFRNFQDQPILKNQIKLEQNQSQKLSVQKYRDLIYKFFTSSKKQQVQQKIELNNEDNIKQISQSKKFIGTKSKFTHKKYNSLHSEFAQSTINHQKDSIQQNQKSQKELVKFNIKKHAFHSTHKSNLIEQFSQKNSIIKTKLPVFDHINISLNKQPKKSFLETIKATPIIQGKHSQTKLFKFSKKDSKKQHSFQSFIQKARIDVMNQSQLKLAQKLKKQYILNNKKLISKSKPNTPRKNESKNPTLWKNSIKQNVLIMQETQKAVLNPIKKRKANILGNQYSNNKHSAV